MTISDRILGVVGGAMVMAALVLLVLGGTRGRGAAATGVAPGIEIVSPTDGAVLEGPLEVVFRVPAEREMAMGAGGWCGSPVVPAQPPVGPARNLPVVPAQVGTQFLVVPAPGSPLVAPQSGTRFVAVPPTDWIPACAGMTLPLTCPSPRSSWVSSR